MTISISLQLAVKEKVNECLSILLGEDVADRLVVIIQFKKNMGVTAGLAYSGKLRIILNEELFLANQKDFFEDIIPHECCHIAQYILYPDEEVDHGKHWKELMKVLRLKPTVYHDLDVSAVDNKVFRYVCNCDNGFHYHQILEKVHKQLQSGDKTTRCGRCDSRITYFPRTENY